MLKIGDIKVVNGKTFSYTGYGQWEEMPSSSSTKERQDAALAELEKKADLTETQPVSIVTNDNTILFTGNITTTGAGTAINTTGYASIVAQFSGTWAGIIHCEVSNDNVNWDRVMFYSSDELALQQKVDTNGLYNISVSGKYVRPYIIALTGTLVVTIIGRTFPSNRAVDMLSLALDKENDIQMQVQFPKPLKQDTDGALVLSDMKPFLWKTGSTAESIIIDCTGYKSVLVHKTTSGIVTPTVSNDGINYVASLAAPVSTMVAAATMPTATNVYIMPVVSKWLKLTSPASSVTCYIYLSQAPFTAYTYATNQTVNIAQVAGTNTVTAGIGGIQAVGGNIAAGAAQTANPLVIGAVDDNKTPLTRRVLSDVTGRQIISTESQTGIRQFGFDNSYKNILSVIDVSKIDGLTNSELLQEILMELKVLNHQMFELPRLIDEGRHAEDEPQQIKESINN